MMTDQEYSDVQRSLLLLASVAAELDLAGYLDRIALVHSVGALLDPTLYRAALYNRRDPNRPSVVALDDLQALAEAAQAFAAKAVEIRGRWGLGPQAAPVREGAPGGG
jgi:hypothetical protein